MLIREIFKTSMRTYCSDENLITNLFNKIAIEYNSEKRFYHNFEHIEQMLKEVPFFTKEIEKMTNLNLAIIYHDVIYNAKKGNNEEKSANFAKQQLQNSNFPEKEIEEIGNMIIATKLHKAINSNFDEKLLLDLDLMILGDSNKNYMAYAEKIREEYKFVPLFLYRRKRKEVLEIFLKTKRIFLTNTFYSNFEEKARRNIQSELSLYT